MKKAFEQVKDFHVKQGCCIGSYPAVPDCSTVKLRVKLLWEESEELLTGLREEDLVKIADGAADLCYVVIGLCVSYGIYLPDIWEAVHAANMLKEGTQESGKAKKPDGFEHPDIEKILREQSIRATKEL